MNYLSICLLIYLSMHFFFFLSLFLSDSSTTCPADLWQREWGPELNPSCAVRPSSSVALQGCHLQRSCPVLLVSPAGASHKDATVGSCDCIIQAHGLLLFVQLPLKGSWRRCAAIWPCPPICSSSSRSTETLLLCCCRGWWYHLFFFLLFLKLE